MTTPDTAQATGPMTLEQGVQALKAKLAGSKATIDDAIKVNPPDPVLEEPAEESTGDEAAAEENTEAAPADEPKEQDAEPDNRPIILPDGSEVTVEEARKGYLRQADYTRKSQDLARAREVAQADHSNAMKEVASLVQQLSQFQEQEPNWLQLAQDPNTDPKQLRAAELFWQQRKATMAAAQQKIRDSEARQLQSQKAAAFQALNEGRFEPTWKDPKVLKSALDRISEYWIDRGLPANMLEGIANPTIIEMLEESRRYREAKAAQPKATLAVKGKPAPIKPGAKSTASPQSENLRLLDERFRKNPTVDNAAALYKARAGLR